MPLSRARDYLSIGEVLEAVRPEFPDVSISKIRFLENEGLINPERTPSGYRKFYEGDVERLRYILSLQRDHFLPLKVIKQRLADGNGATAPPPSGAPSATGARGAPSHGVDMTDVSLTRAQLRDASGLSEAELAGLEDFGLLERGAGTYDGEDLIAAKAARGLFQYGVEPRHLRMYKQFGEREAAFLRQIVSPIARKRDPEGHRQAAESARALLEMSRQLRDVMVRAGLRELLAADQ